ncbi:MAG: penicillin acylase family protein [Calditrichaeota bacterium]|nr:penicillin acylase family protein [Calditrichota bacterium]
MKWTPAIVCVVIFFGLFAALDRSISPQVPFPLGKFFNPYSGFWANGDKKMPLNETVDLPELKESVAISWDDRGIPHIFAQNDHDLYMVQGFVEARDRLWQMEFLTYVAAGRLAEILGNKPQIVAHDHFRRRVGMVYAAENALKSVRQDAQAYQAVEAYAKGVNAWIRQLDESKLPLEYKILDYKPEIWTPLKSALVLKMMSWDLTGRNEEVQYSEIRNAMGGETTANLFEATPFKMEAIMPENIRWAFSPVDRPKAPDSLFSGKFHTDFDQIIQPEANNGSNNWVVAGSKTATGKPILCNDPHLKLNLPSIWYESQLISPSVNVYGVSLPGVPMIIIGFNKNVAWGVTNAGTDVMDWYKIKFKNAQANEYFYDGEWLPTQKRSEAIKIRGAKTVFDTVAYTHHGPVSYMDDETPFSDNVPTGAALRWTAHDPSNEVKAFYLMNRAENLQDYNEAQHYFECPAQNIVFASVDGDIALRHSGKFPVRWPQQGRYISDGTDAAYDWKNYIPFSQLPYSENPRQGFLASANQKPVDENYPYLMLGQYATFERGARIHERLRELSEITPQGMMRLQLDNRNLRARTVLPTMLAALDTTQMTAGEHITFIELSNWKFDNQHDFIAPTIFEYWFEALTTAIWDDDLPGNANSVFLYPNDDVTMRLLSEDTASTYFDDRLTPEVEQYGDIVQKTFRETTDKLTQKFGEFGNAWRWGTARGTEIQHLARMSGLGRKKLPTDGDAIAVNAIKANHGPSWRMIVQLDSPKPIAWGIYPGGQTGNPGSKKYDQFIDPWVAGLYYELLYLTSPGEIHERLVNKTFFQKTNQR